MKVSKDTPLPDIDTPHLTLPEPHPEASHKVNNKCIPGDTHFSPKRVPLNDQCPNLDVEPVQKRQPSFEQKKPPSLKPSNRASADTKEEPVQKRQPSLEPMVTSLARRMGTLPVNLAPSDIPVVASKLSDEDTEHEMERQLNLMRSHLQNSRQRYSMRKRKECSGDDFGTLERGSSLHCSVSCPGGQRACLKGRYSRKPEDTIAVSRGPNPSQSHCKCHSFINTYN